MQLQWLIPCDVFLLLFLSPVWTSGLFFTSSLLCSLQSVMSSGVFYRWAFYTPDGPALDEVSQLVDAGKVLRRLVVNDSAEDGGEGGLIWAVVSEMVHLEVL